MKKSKNDYSPNDRFLIKIFIKIISLDSSQRVPPMSLCPPLIITMVCPQLINHLSDPWDFNKSNRIQLRSNWRKPYPKFCGSELLLIKGDQENDLQGRVLTFWGGEGWLIRCWHYNGCSLIRTSTATIANVYYLVISSMSLLMHVHGWYLRISKIRWNANVLKLIYCILFLGSTFRWVKYSIFIIIYIYILPIYI